MNVGFDAKRLFLNFTGLGNYSRFIVKALHQSFADDNYFLFTPRLRHSPDSDYFLNKKNVSVIASRWPGPLKSIWRSIGISFSSEVRQLDIFHGLSHEIPFLLPKTTKKVVTVHDLIFMRYPEFYSAIDRKIYKAKVKYACESADIVIAISEQTASDISEFLHVPSEKIRVVYQGCHEQFNAKVSKELMHDIKIRYQLPGKYILNLGTIEPRKNALSIVSAMKYIPQSKRLPLVIVGRRTDYFEKIKSQVISLHLENEVKFIHEARFADLPAIYQSSAVFVYPSLFEGFGIPIIEAIKSGVPVISSTGSCFQEAGGPDCIYLNPSNEESLADAILQLTEDSGLKDKMIANSSEYIKKFDSNVIGKELHKVYESCL